VTLVPLGGTKRKQDVRTGAIGWDGCKKREARVEGKGERGEDVKIKRGVGKEGERGALTLFIEERRLAGLRKEDQHEQVGGSGTSRSTKRGG